MVVQKTHKPSTRRPAIQLHVKTILNRIQHFTGFVYREVRFQGQDSSSRIDIHLESHAAVAGKCAHCLKATPGYDRLPQRSWSFVPLWGIPVDFFYTPRRVNCPEDGIGVEHIPWSAGKRPVTITMMVFLARWARRMSWRETARAFQTSWEAVYRPDLRLHWRRIAATPGPFCMDPLALRPGNGAHGVVEAHPQHLDENVDGM